ncbi:MAG: sigma-54 dependent transcriptional regulator [Sumerlaeia bacterium]
MTARILILDDEQKMASLLERSLAREGWEAEAMTLPAAALERLKAEPPIDVLVTDLRMPGLDGLEVLRRAKAIRPGIDVVLMTAFASVETAREALTHGAADYLVKPVSAETDLKPLLRRLLEGNDEGASREAVAPPSATAAVALPGDAILASPAMRGIMGKLDKIARSNATVLLRGESGTGKEVMADLMQSRSTRAGRPYLKINCGALPETLLESELFGHVKGSFTGADRDREGLFAAADGGTLLLDEVGEVSPALQVKLLRVLQSGELIPVGGNKSRKVDVRVIAATNRDLEAMMESGDFRNDLYYRLNVVPLTLPPLRERPEDLEALIAAFARRFSGGRDVVFGEDAREALHAYRWPGNIRELENAIEHALVLGEPEGITVEDLPLAVQEHRRKSGAAPGTHAPAATAAGAATLESIERKCLLSALERTGGNRTRAAKLLGITRRTLGYRLKKYELEGEVARLARSEDDEYTT